MNQQLLPVVAVIVFAVLPPGIRSQDPVPIQFQTNPVLAVSGTEAVMTVITVPQVLSMTWESPARETLGLWVASGSVINPVAQYQGRITITATQLRIAATQLRDTGNYTVTVDPIATTGQGPNSRSVAVRVFDAVEGVRLLLPSVAIEGGNVSLRCTWTRGTNIRVIWGKGGAAITPDSRVTISGGSLVINPARRGDAGDYSCTVSNLVSAQTVSASLTVFYGPDTPRVDQGLQADCVGGGQAVVGQTVRLTCVSDSVPPALFSWQHNGVPVASGQPDSGVLSIQTFSTNQSGRYVCTARNTITGRTSEQGTDVVIVSTCLSGGAVAGIVIGCVLALILIIIAIFLLVRWRKVDRRLREATGNHKRDQDPQRHNPPLQPTLPHPRNHAQPLGHSRPGDHQLHDLNTRHHNGYALPQDSYQGVNMHQNHHQGNGNALQRNGQQNTNAFPPNGIADVDTFMQNGWQNHNTFPHNGQQNPNILIQTGQNHPSAMPPTVHVNLNTLPQSSQQPNNAQPHTVHVNLNTYPNGGQQDPHTLQHTNQHTNHTPQHTNHQSHDSMAQIGHSDRTPLIQTEVSHPTDHTPRVSHNPRSNGALIETGYSHLVNPVPAGQRNANTQTYQADPNPRSRRDPAETRSVSHDQRDPARSQIRGTQRPWDRERGTPAYPNRGFQEDSDTSTDRAESQSRRQTEAGRSDPGRQLPDSAHNGRRKRPAETHTAERSPRSRVQTVTLNSDPSTPPPPYNHSDSRTPVNSQNQTTPRTRFVPHSEDVQRPVPSQGADRQPVSQSFPTSPAQAAAHNALQQRPQILQNHNVAMPAETRNVEPRTRPLHQGIQQQGAPHGPSAQAPLTRQPAAPVPGQTMQNRQGPPTAAPNPSSLTQSALQAHTTRTPNPFPSRNHQTAAALRNPGAAQPRPRDTGPAPPTAPQAAAPNHRPPTPPPVLPLTQFQTLPRERLPEPAARPLPIPAAVPHRHHTQPNRQRHPQHATRHPTHGHATAHRQHANAHMHPTTGHRHPTNQRQQQAAWGRARR